MTDLKFIEVSPDLANAPVPPANNCVNIGNQSILLETGTYNLNGPNISRADNNNIQDPKWQLEVRQDMSVLAISLSDKEDVYFKRDDIWYKLTGKPLVLYDGDQIRHTPAGQSVILRFNRTFNFDPSELWR